MSNKKINEALGIGSIDEFLSDLNIDSQISTMNGIDEKVQENVEKIDCQIAEYQKNGLTNIDVADIRSSLGEIKDLIDVAKQTIRKVYESIEDSELLDSEMIHALAALMESSHLTIKEYIELYRDRQSFFDKIRLETLKQQHKIEQMKLKQQFDIEKMNMTSKEPTHQVENMVSFNQEDIIDILKES